MTIAEWKIARARPPFILIIYRPSLDLGKVCLNLRQLPIGKENHHLGLGIRIEAIIGKPGGEPGTIGWALSFVLAPLFSRAHIDRLDGLGTLLKRHLHSLRKVFVVP